MNRGLATKLLNAMMSRKNEENEKFNDQIILGEEVFNKVAGWFLSRKRKGTPDDVVIADPPP